MWPGLVVVDHILSEDPPQMWLVQHDRVVQAVSPHAADYTLGEWVCQGEYGAIFTSSIPMASTLLEK